MLLTSRPSLRTMPESIILTTVIIALLFAAGYIAFFLGRPPFLLVRGVKTYIPQAKPAIINESYVDGFSRLFVDRYASWNVYNFRSNRNRALKMIASDLGSAVAYESQMTERLVGMLQNARQIRIDQVIIAPIGNQRWSVGVILQQTDFDGGVGRGQVFRRIDLLVQSITPSLEVPYCLEVVTFTERLLTPDEIAALPPPRPTPNQSLPSSTPGDDWTQPTTTVALPLPPTPTGTTP
jgi:hypothetical protein